MGSESREHMEQEYGAEVLYEKRRRRRRKIVSTIIAWLFAILVIIVILIGVVAVVRAIGGNRLRNAAASNKPNLMMEETTSGQNGADATEAFQETPTAAPQEEAVVWQEGWVRHNGKIYEYNEDIMTFLVMGIDKNSEVKESTTDTGGGQADALFLVVVDGDTEEIRIVAINRDTMTEIDAYGYGDYEGYGQTMIAQIATQHGFGDGMELSCELTVNTVSELFFDLPIHGYASINMAAIADINDAIGGVEVTVLEDLTKAHKSWTEGTQVTLEGEDAYDYVHWRDLTLFESNRGRLARQKQYLSAFMNKAKTEIKKDITLPVTMYGELSKYMVTDVTVDEVAYLAGELLDYEFNADDIYTLEGTTEMGEKHEEFYPDYDALKELMIEVFYREVSE